MRGEPLRSWLRVSEVAELWDVSRQTVYNAVAAGTLRTVRRGPHRAIRVALSEALRHIHIALVERLH